MAGEGYEYVLANAGVVTTPEDEGYEFSVVNVGVVTTPEDEGYEYALVGDVTAEVYRLIQFRSGGYWEDGPLRYWNGKGWITASPLRYWSGTEWVDVP